MVHEKVGSHENFFAVTFIELPSSRSATVGIEAGHKLAQAENPGRNF